MLNPDFDEETMRSVRLTKEIMPMLRGQGPAVQGAVLAQLLALWLAGHQGPDHIVGPYRENLLNEICKTVRALIPDAEAEIASRQVKQ